MTLLSTASRLALFSRVADPKVMSLPERMVWSQTSLTRAWLESLNAAANASIFYVGEGTRHEITHQPRRKA